MRLTRVVLLCLALIMSFGFYRLVVYLLDDVDAQTFQATEEVMVDTAHILAGLLEANPDHSEQHIRATFTHAMEHQIDARIHNHAKSSIGINAYVCNAQGEVIFDSTKQRTGKDFSQHNDVLLTLRGEYGARSSRENENDPNSSILYVAAPVKRNGKIIGTVTVYKAQSDVSHFISERRRDILTATLLIGGGIVLFTIAVFIWLFRPVGQLTEYAHAISRGERRPLPNLGKGREVNTLGNALHDMRETLEGRRYVENYISALTHELKSPLAAIRGAAELLDETMPPEQQAKFLHNIRTETSRSETLVNNLLLLSELEGKPHLENLRAFDLAKLCRELADEAQPRLTPKGLTLHCELPDHLSYSGDQMMLRLAIANLLENAISFSSDQGAITMRVQTEKTSLTLQIDDNGTGAPDYALKRAFEHFYSLPRPGSNRKSSGLGLALVREAVKLHQGTATLENLPAGGCRATLQLPLLAD